MTAVYCLSRKRKARLPSTLPIK